MEGHLEGYSRLNVLDYDNNICEPNEDVQKVFLQLEKLFERADFVAENQVTAILLVWLSCKFTVFISEQRTSKNHCAVLKIVMKNYIKIKLR